jgi:hypothetical protein
VLRVLVLREMYNDSMMFVQSKYKLMIQPHIEVTFAAAIYNLQYSKWNGNGIAVKDKEVCLGL